MRAIAWRWSGWLLGVTVVCPAYGQEPTWDLPKGLKYATEARTEPRPLHIHRLTIELTAESLEFVVVAGQDPDGDGPVEAVLAPPTQLGEQAKAIAVINTSAWAMFPDKETGKKPGYVVGGHADILGWVSQGEKPISPIQTGYWTCWMDIQRRVFISSFGEKPESERPNRSLWAVSGFRGILADGEILPDPSEVRHPRTALGLSSDGNRMTWIVVDGRQPGYSEGVSEQELAQLMIEAGCDDALNLDGGGSSVMLLRDRAGVLSPANRPSERTGQRPVPVVLCVRKTEQSN
jgi:hypothetical protein